MGLAFLAGFALTAATTAFRLGHCHPSRRFRCPPHDRPAAGPFQSFPVHDPVTRSRRPRGRSNCSKLSVAKFGAASAAQTVARGGRRTNPKPGDPIMASSHTPPPERAQKPLADGADESGAIAAAPAEVAAPDSAPPPPHGDGSRAGNPWIYCACACGPAADRRRGSKEKRRCHLIPAPNV